MAAPSVVSTSTGQSPATGLASSTLHTITLPTGSGGLLIAIVCYGVPDSSGILTAFPGWTLLSSTYLANVSARTAVYFRWADGSEGANVTVTTNFAGALAWNAYRLSGAGADPVAAGWAPNQGGDSSTSGDAPALTTGFGAVDTLFFAICAHQNGDGMISAYPSGYASGLDYNATPAGPGIGSARKSATAASDDPGTFTVSHTGWISTETIAVKGLATPDAEFSWDRPASLTLDFTDESTGVPTSWAWNFGDGHTSTVPNPTHLYAAAGTYTVTLTVTNGVGSDSVSHDIAVTIDVPYEAPPPGLAILEIYVNDPNGPNWDEALWDEADWGSAGWVDVTPEGVTVDIQWGSTRPELGILTVPEAANWYITFYDPARLLDPANAASPYQSDLRPGLPHRISHRGVVIKTGQADVIGHGYKDDDGLIRGSDIISLMARADVPDDLVLDTTLAGRARDVIAAAGLPIIVYTGDLGGDGPSLGAKLTGNKTVWEHIKDAAQAVLHFPYVTKDNHLGFRAYADPVDRGRVIASPNLVDASSIVDTAGLVSEVLVQETVADGGSIIDRAITPPPWFGVRVFERTEETPDAETWADMVLADRSLLTLRWVPGAVYPITADDVDYFSGMLPLELVGISIPEQSVSAPAVIVGGTIQVVGRKDQSADWRFEFEAAATALTTGDAPLYADGGIASDYLTTESGSEYLYPD